MFSLLLSDSRLWENLYFQLYFSIGNKPQHQCFQIVGKQGISSASILFEEQFLIFIFIVTITPVIFQWLLFNY